MKLQKLLLKYSFEIFIILIGLIFGFILMFSTFGWKDNTILISTKAWSDFASHIPLIRSFSLGSNFPPEYPLFPREPIKYHFLFYAVVGILEKIGLPIDLALNIPSILGFAFLILIIYFFARNLFKSKLTAILSVIFFLFNSSLSFIYFFRNHPLSSSTINQIITNTQFQSFAPYGEGLITAFWNLNIYTNQRHLALSFAASLIAIYLIAKPILGKKVLNTKWHIVLGILLGLSFFLHTAVLLMTCATVFVFAILFPKIRKNVILTLIIAAIITVPQFLYSKGSGGFSPQIVFGYLISNNLTIEKFFEFWIYNLGLSIVLIPLGFLASNKIQRKIFLSFFILFVIGNTVQFSPEIAANHKFFNYFIIVANMFSAFFLVKLWRKTNIFKPIVAIASFLMVFGGIIDFFPIYNDYKVVLADYKINKEASWIVSYTSPDSIFLNTTFLYNPASLAGRKIFLGWPYFAWSQGYDTNKQGQTMKMMLGAKDKSTACKLLKRNKIDYIEIQIQNPPNPDIPLISDIFEKEFIKSYDNKNKNYSIYNVAANCLP